jgi:hypothetical protein
VGGYCGGQSYTYGIAVIQDLNISPVSNRLARSNSITETCFHLIQHPSTGLIIPSQYVKIIVQRLEVGSLECQSEYTQRYDELEIPAHPQDC